MKSIFLKGVFFALLLLGLQSTSLMAQSTADQQRAEKYIAQQVRLYKLDASQTQQLRQIHTQFLANVGNMNPQSANFARTMKDYRADRQEAFIAILTPAQKAILAKREAQRAEREAHKKKRRG